MGKLFLGGNDFIPKRVPQNIDDIEGISSYGNDNEYPQRMENIALSSPLAKECIKVLADFINGDGWQTNG